MSFLRSEAFGNWEAVIWRCRPAVRGVLAWGLAPEHNVLASQERLSRRIRDNPRMDQFNYLAVLISIILGLGITQLLSGFGRWIEHRATFRAYAPAICWAFVLLVIQVQCWWAMFGLREQTDWTFLKFMGG